MIGSNEKSFEKMFVIVTDASAIAVKSRTKQLLTFIFAPAYEEAKMYAAVQ
jgi:hypothetical protein